MTSPKPTGRTQPAAPVRPKRSAADRLPKELARPPRASRPRTKTVGRGFNPGFKRR